MIISLYGERYIPSHRFVPYCISIKADQSLSSRDLEFYEKEGLLLPVARIIQPREYMNLREAQSNPGGNPGVPISGWEELENLLYGNNHDGLWHKFDQEFDQQNKYLISPAKTEYHTWDSYEVEVESSTGEKYMTDTNVSHYYHYWQIYQVYELQSRFPIFSKYQWLYQILNETTSGWADYHHPGTPNQVVDLHGNYPRFDALSFFTTLSANEQVKTFMLPTGGMRQLTSEDIEKYQIRLKEHAEFTVDRFGLKENTEWLYQFLAYLLELQSIFKQQEKVLLAKEIEKDVINLVRFIFYVKDQKFEEIQEILGQQTNIWTKKQFRHIDKASLVYDDVKETFEHSLTDYNNLFSNNSLMKADLEKLLDYLFDNSLFIFPFGVFDISEAYNSEKPFFHTSLYISLSNMSVGYESFLRAILGKRTAVNGKTLRPLITEMFKSEKIWWNQFELKYLELKLNYGEDITFWHLDDTVTDPNLHYMAKAVLTTYLIRNLIMHTATLSDEFYQDIFSEVYKSICHAMFYTWSFSLKQGWI